MKHLEDNFPGTINVFVKYIVEEEERLGGVAGKIGIEYDVRLMGDAQETAIAMTNHRYINLEALLKTVILTSLMDILLKGLQCNFIARLNKTLTMQNYPQERQVLIQISVYSLLLLRFQST